MNELIFLIYIFAICSAALVAIRAGQEALTAFICVQALLINLFVTKTITLFGLTATASDALAVGITLSLNLLQEYYGQAAAKKAIWISFFCSLFYVILSILHLAYIPAASDTSSAHFEQLLSPMPRIIIASLITYLFVQMLDTYIYAYLRKQFSDSYFVRTYGSAALTQLIDTILFSFLGLYNLNPNFSTMHTMFEIIIVSYTIKLLVITIAAPFILWTKKIFKT